MKKCRKLFKCNSPVFHLFRCRQRQAYSYKNKETLNLNKNGKKPKFKLSMQHVLYVHD